MSLGVAILAGGRGTRLRGPTGGPPKALAPLAGGTLLSHQLAAVAPLHARRTVVLLHHAAAEIRAALPAGVEPIVEEAPLGTAGGLALLPPGPARWLIVNVDHVSTFDRAALLAGWVAPGVAALAEREVPVDDGVVRLDGGRIVGWDERPTLRLPVTTGLYVLCAAALRAALPAPTPLDMPALILRLGGVEGRLLPGRWVDAGTPERLAAAARLAPTR